MKAETTPPSFVRIPSVDRILRSDTAAALICSYGRTEVTAKVRLAVKKLRVQVRAGHAVNPNVKQVLTIAAELLTQASAPSLCRVLNLTGTVLHTNLGRALLPEIAIEAVVEVARGASNLEYDLDTGGRGDRDQHLEAAITRLTGAEAATLVNNNAAAVMLVLNTLALGRDVPVSRGELVEIGGSFRIPEIMNRSGCTLVEVGTTNRTHLKDFEQAVGPQTALVMKVHASNYVINGFTAAVPDSDLAALCHEKEIPFVVDLGAGSLTDLERYGLPHEPTPAETLAAGADIVTFSADKLLGGPQGGIIAGRRALIDRVNANPMKRALRCDKMTIAALAAILRLYADPDRLCERLPTLRALTRTTQEIDEVARQLIELLTSKFSGMATVSIVDCESVVGSGALPTRVVPSRGIAIKPLEENNEKGTMVGRIAKAFVALPTPVIGRIHAGAFLLDLRCLQRAEELAELMDNLCFDA